MSSGKILTTSGGLPSWDFIDTVVSANGQVLIGPSSSVPSWGTAGYAMLHVDDVLTVSDDRLPDWEPLVVPVCSYVTRVQDYTQDLFLPYVQFHRPTGWEQPGYDDSAWTHPNVNYSYTQAILVRRHFSLANAYAHPAFWSASFVHQFGNNMGADVYLNGHFVGTRFAAQIEMDIPASYFNNGGDNVLAIALYWLFGSYNFFWGMSEVECTLPATYALFDSNIGAGQSWTIANDAVTPATYSTFTGNQPRGRETSGIQFGISWTRRGFIDTFWTVCVPQSMGSLNPSSRATPPYHPDINEVDLVHVTTFGGWRRKFVPPAQLGNRVITGAKLWFWFPNLVTVMVNGFPVSGDLTAGVAIDPASFDIQGDAENVLSFQPQGPPVMPLGLAVANNKVYVASKDFGGHTALVVLNMDGTRWTGYSGPAGFANQPSKIAYNPATNQLAQLDASDSGVVTYSPDGSNAVNHGNVIPWLSGVDIEVVGRNYWITNADYADFPFGYWVAWYDDVTFARIGGVNLDTPGPLGGVCKVGSEVWVCQIVDGSNVSSSIFRLHTDGTSAGPTINRSYWSLAIAVVGGSVWVAPSSSSGGVDRYDFSGNYVDTIGLTPLAGNVQSITDILQVGSEGWVVDSWSSVIHRYDAVSPVDGAIPLLYVNGAPESALAYRLAITYTPAPFGLFDSNIGAGQVWYYFNDAISPPVVSSITGNQPRGRLFQPFTITVPDMLFAAKMSATTPLLNRANGIPVYTTTAALPSPPGDLISASAWWEQWNNPSLVMNTTNAVVGPVAPYSYRGHLVRGTSVWDMHGSVITQSDLATGNVLSTVTLTRNFGSCFDVTDSAIWYFSLSGIAGDRSFCRIASCDLTGVLLTETVLGEDGEGWSIAVVGSAVWAGISLHASQCIRMYDFSGVLQNTLLSVGFPTFRQYNDLLVVGSAVYVSVYENDNGAPFEIHIMALDFSGNLLSDTHLVYGSNVPPILAYVPSHSVTITTPVNWWTTGGFNDSTSDWLTPSHTPGADFVTGTSTPDVTEATVLVSTWYQAFFRRTFVPASVKGMIVTNALLYAQVSGSAVIKHCFLNGTEITPVPSGTGRSVGIRLNAENVLAFEVDALGSLGISPASYTGINADLGGFTVLSWSGTINGDGSLTLTTTFSIQHAPAPFSFYMVRFIDGNGFAVPGSFTTIGGVQTSFSVNVPSSSVTLPQTYYMQAWVSSSGTTYNSQLLSLSAVGTTFPTNLEYRVAVAFAFPTRVTISPNWTGSSCTTVHETVCLISFVAVDNGDGSVTLTATTNTDVGPTWWFIEIQDDLPSTIAFAGRGKTVSATVQYDPTTTHTYKAVLDDRITADDVQSGPITITWSPH